MLNLYAHIITASFWSKGDNYVVQVCHPLKIFNENMQRVSNSSGFDVSHQTHSL